MRRGIPTSSKQGGVSMGSTLSSHTYKRGGGGYVKFLGGGC